MTIDDLFVLPNCETKKFVDVFESYNDFYYYYLHCGIPTTIASDAPDRESNLRTLYYLLYAKYGNNNITNLDENQWIYKVFSTIYKYGPTWEKKLDIQGKLRGIQDDDLLVGAKAIYNHAYNPETAPSTQTLDELTYINDQNTTNYKKSKMDAYTQLWGLLATDVTEDFLSRFSPLFKKFISPFTRLYESEED